MVRRLSLFVAMLAAVAAQAPLAAADVLQVGLPDEVKFVVRVDMVGVQGSPVAGRVLASAKDELFAKLVAKDKGLSQEKVVEVLGFDPFQEIQTVFVATADYEVPDTSMVIGVQLRKTTGNLEGLLLTVPGYSVEEYGDHQIYSAMPDDATRVFCVFHTDATGGRSVFVAARRESLVNILDSLAGQVKSSDAPKSVSLGGEGNPLVSVQLFELPPEMSNLEGPPANVAKIVRNLAVQVTEADGAVNVLTRLLATADKQAEQLEQMIKGMHAMVGLAASAKEDEKLQMLAKYLTDVTVTRDGTTVDVKLTVPSADVQQLIDENLFKK